MAWHAALWTHAGAGNYRRRRRGLSSPPPLLLLLACLAAVLVLPSPQLSRPAAAATATTTTSTSTSTVVTLLPGFDGPLPFYLETGYVGIDEETGAELFYYLVESERSPRTDPLILWLSGGPRCSVLCGLALQIGPLKFVGEPYDGTLPRMVYNPYSWTQMASILFLDSPVGSGFSYARDPKAYEVGDISSSRQVLTFLRKWFDDHPKDLLDRPFYIGGDSYAGKVVPLIAHYISEGIEEMQQPLIKLKGYIVGNPFTDKKIDVNSQVTFSHSFGIISDQQYEAFMKNCKGDFLNPTNEPCCDVVVQTIKKLMSEVTEANILQPICHIPSRKRRGALEGLSSLAEERYHYQLVGGAPDEPPFYCFHDYLKYLSYFWANDNAIRAALGVKEGTVTEWIRCKTPPILPYAYDLPSNLKYHFSLVIRGYRALVYSGDHDLTIPFVGTQAWTRSFNFSIVDDWRAWHLDNQAAGFTITYDTNLTFATIKGGGHVTTETNPEESFTMAKRWLDNESL